MAKAQSNIRQGFKPDPDKGYASKVVFWLTDPLDPETRIEITEDEVAVLMALDGYYYEEGDEDDSAD